MESLWGCETALRNASGRKAIVTVMPEMNRGCMAFQAWIMTDVV